MEASDATWAPSRPPVRSAQPAAADLLFRVPLRVEGLGLGFFVGFSGVGGLGFRV